ncbi:eIF-2-alpha kinase activator GCN1, partial [Sarracenia purpurea var. burkii]
VWVDFAEGLEDKAWRTKQASVQLLGAMAYCAPQQLSQCLPKVVPKLTEVLTDTHPKVQSARQTTLQQVVLCVYPNDYTKHSHDILLQTTFINSIDAPSLALLVPIVHRGLRQRSTDTKKKAAQIVGNICSLVTEPKDMIPYIGLLLPEVKKMEMFGSNNKGYHADMNVVTFCQNRKDINDKSKYRILLISLFLYA